MSLVTGLLNKTVDVYRPILTDDGAGGEIFTLPQTPTYSGVPCLITNKFSSVLTPTGGRQLVETWTGYFEEPAGSLLITNDVLKNIADINTGSVMSALVNGIKKPMAFKLQNSLNPNVLVDGTGHVEVVLAIVYGREAGLP